MPTFCHHVVSSPQRCTSRWCPRHTQWHREFVAHLTAERPALREAQVVGVRRPPAANQTSLLGDRFDVIAVAPCPRPLASPGRDAGSEFIGAARRFGAFKLLMFFQDKNAPHVHITGRDFAAKIRLANGELIAGDAPNRVLAEARRWIQENQAQLLQLWNEFQRGPE
jgi:hypothetical protein